MIICGIDPGDKGGVSFLDTSSLLLKTYDMPLAEKIVKSQKTGTKKTLCVDGHKFAIMLKDNNPNIIFIEKILPSYGTKGGVRQGAVSNANFFGDFMYLNGAMDALEFKRIEVLPQKWKSFLHLIGEDKSMSVNLAMNIFNEQKNEFWRKNLRNKDKIILLDGRAESALIAYYGMKNLC